MYQSVDNGSTNGSNGVSDEPRKNKSAKIFIAVAAIVALAGVYLASTPGPDKDSVKKAMAKSDLNVKANGKLKLFDSQSK